jgi:molybdenum cofactor synthesis domain-containing protein
LIVGNEILSGRTRDCNAHFLAVALKGIGVTVGRIVVIPDLPHVIADEVNRLRTSFDYVLACGGIGPTPDDVTRPAVAQAFGIPCEPHAEAVRILRDYYGERATPRRMVMAELPRDAELIPNPRTIALGFRVANVFVLPGIPELVEDMFPYVAASLQHGTLVEVEFPVTLPESDFADIMELGALQFPTVECGSYPSCSGGQWRGALVLKSHEAAQVAAAETWFRAALEQRASELAKARG